jgi:hypothetical protein
MTPPAEQWTAQPDKAETAAVPSAPGHTHLDRTVTWHRAALARCTISQPRRVTA